MAPKSFVASLTETWTAPALAPASVGALSVFPFARRGVASSVDTRITTSAALRILAAGVAFLSAPAWAADQAHRAAHLALGAGAVVVVTLFIVLPLFLRGRS